LSDHLIPPHGGDLVDLFANEKDQDELKSASRDWPSHDLTARQQCDLELLICGGFSPLTGFLGQKDYESVCSEMTWVTGRCGRFPSHWIFLNLSQRRLSQAATWHCGMKKA
jgi:sulfate adenylyltransferase